MTEEIENAIEMYDNIEKKNLSELPSLRVKMEEEFDNFLNADFRTKLSRTHLTVKENAFYDKLIEHYNKKNEEQIKLQNLMMGERYSVFPLDDYYLFVVCNDKLKIAQYAENYIGDELLMLDNFLKSVDLDKLKTQVSKTYIVSDKIRDKYIKKAEKKEKETIYNNYNLGIEILNYIYGNSNFNYLGERYGIENHVLDKLADLDSADSKLIIIVNLDALGVEVFYSVPYNLLQKGTAGLESELIYRSRINEFVLQEYLDAIIK